MLNMLLLCLEVDQYIVEVDNHELIQILSQYIINKSLKCC